MTTATVQVSLTEFLSTVLQGSAAGVSADSYDPPKLMLLGDRGRRWACLHSVCTSVTESAVFASWLKTAYVSDLTRKEQYEKASESVRLAGYVLPPALLLFSGRCLYVHPVAVYLSFQ